MTVEGEKPVVEGEGNTTLAGGEKPVEGQKQGEGEGKSVLGGAPGSGEGEGEGKEGVKTGEGKAEGEGEAGAPTEYTAFTLPDGVSMPEEALTKFSELAKGSNLTQDAAQKLVDLSIGESQRAADAQAQAWKETQEGWVDSLKKDMEFGGGKYPETVERAVRAVRRFGGDSLVDFLNASGLGNHAELVKTFARIDRAVSEDKVVDGKPGTVEKSLAEKLYPNLK